MFDPITFDQLTELNMKPGRKARVWLRALGNPWQGFS